MSSIMTPLNGENKERVTQLVNKTNQFNLTTRRYTGSEVERISADENHITIAATLSDKFGDNGLVSVLFAKIDGEVCEVELFVMSCRVFKRGLEYGVINFLVDEAKKRGAKIVRGSFLPTKKNMPCADFYKTANFKTVKESAEETVFEAEISDFDEIKTQININPTI